MSDPVEVEQIKLSGIALIDILKPEFVKALSDKGLNVEYTFMHAFVREEAKEKDAESTLIRLNLFHTQPKEIAKRTIHIECEKEAYLRAVEAVLKEVVTND